MWIFDKISDNISFVFFIFVTMKFDPLYLIAIVSIIANVVLVILFVHSRRSYSKLMSKCLKEEQRKEALMNDLVYDASVLLDEHDKVVLKSLRQCLEEEKVYLNPDLSIQELARLVGTNKSRLSHVINTGLGQNYASLVNRYRVKESIQLLSDEQYFLEKLEAIGEMCGYSNRQAFHAAFKKEMGITPMHFRNINKNRVKKDKAS